MVDQVGLRVRNQNNILQIDGDYQNLQLISVADYTLSQGPDGVRGRYVDIYPPSNRENVLLAVRIADRGVYIKKINSSAFRIYHADNIGGPPLVVKVFMFANSIEDNNGIVGLIVRSRLTGKVVFNSNNKYLRILSFLPIFLNIPPANDPNPTSVSYSFGSKTIAVIQCLRIYSTRRTVVGPVGQQVGLVGFFSGLIRTPSASTVLIEHGVVYSGIGGPPINAVSSQPNGLYLIVDVTGY